MGELAVLGGRPAFDEPLHVGRPNQANRARFLHRVEEILDRNWLTNDGPVLREFEGRLVESTGTANAIAVSNGTLALALGARALELDGEVIMPSFTFVGTAHAIRWQGLRPVFCDVDPGSHCLDLASARGLVTDRTAAILPVHLWGNVCDTDAIEAFADSIGVPVMYDAAHALECGRAGRRVGSFGRAEVFSFHATKFVHSLEGGAITTDDGDLADRLRSLRNFGFAGYDRVEALGLNAKMSEISAAMGLTVFERVDEIVERNRANRDAYARVLGDVPGLRLVDTGSNDRSNLQYVVFEVDARVAGLSRDAIVDALWSEGVLARRYFTPGCHRSAPYRDEGAVGHLDVTDRLSDQVMVLPSGLALEAETARVVGQLVVRMLGSADRVRRALMLDEPAAEQET